MPERLALFDPDSYYNRLRACIRPEDKLRGFFHWLHVRDRYAPAPGGPAGRRPALRLVLSAGRPEEPIAAHVEANLVADDRGGTRLVPSVGLQRPPGDIPQKKTACRVYLLEQAVLERLRAADPALREEPDDTLPGKVFQNERVAANWEVARILSAVPELEGQLDENGHGDFPPCPLPENCPIRSLPEDVHVVVVLDAPVGARTDEGPPPWLQAAVLKQLLAYLREPEAPAPLTEEEGECLVGMAAARAQGRAWTVHEVRGVLGRGRSLPVVSDALQTATEKGYLVEEQRPRAPGGTAAAVRTRGTGGASPVETVYRPVPAKMAAALCQGLLAGRVSPSAEVRQALLGLAEDLGVPPAILEHLRRG
jgi:hypothetical protein